MSERPHIDILRSEISGVLADDVARFRTVLYYPENDEVVYREIKGCGFDMCVIFVDGMASSEQISDFIIRAVQSDGNDVAPENRENHLVKCAVQAAQCSTERRLSELVKMILSGMAVVLADGMETALTLDVRGFEKRKVNIATKERVVVGPQEGFVEDLRTNLTLLHRYIQTPELICEKMELGTKIPLRAALLHIEGVTDPGALGKVRAKLKTLDAPVAHGAGQLQQILEENPWSLMPQMLMTERPDRAAAALSDGQFVILTDKSPYALIAPCSFFNLMQSPDDAHSRWQYGSYSRIIRYTGLFIALFLPALYVALTDFHTNVIPMPLLTSIARTRASVPFPVLFEVAAMELSFFLINEANMRIPSQIGSFIGIIGALVLGQAAVEASLISPILIILIAISGLGCYAMPDYSVSVSIVLYRLSLVAAGAFFGIYGIVLGSFLFLCQLCSMRSFGVEYMAPVAPHARHNPDIIMRLPVFMQKLPLYLVPESSWLRRKKKS